MPVNPKHSHAIGSIITDQCGILAIWFQMKQGPGGNGKSIPIRWAKTVAPVSASLGGRRTEHRSLSTDRPLKYMERRLAFWFPVHSWIKPALKEAPLLVLRYLAPAWPKRRTQIFHLQIFINAIARSLPAAPLFLLPVPARRRRGSPLSQPQPRQSGAQFQRRCRFRSQP
jgi:hypothetical protein